MLLISAVSTRSADCNGELCVAMQIYRPVCLAALAAEDEYTRLRRGETDKRQRRNGNETQKDGKKRAERREWRAVKEKTEKYRQPKKWR